MEKSVAARLDWTGLANTPPIYEQDMRPQCGEMDKCNWKFAAHLELYLPVELKRCEGQSVCY